MGDVDGLRDGEAEMFCEQVCQAFAPVGGGDGVRLLIGKILDPGRVVEGLGDDVARSFVSLEFEDDQIGVAVDCEEVNMTSVAGDNLPPNEE